MTLFPYKFQRFISNVDSKISSNIKMGNIPLSLCGKALVGVRFICWVRWLLAHIGGPRFDILLGLSTEVLDQMDTEGQQ